MSAALTSTSRASAATLAASKGAEMDMSIASETAMVPSNPATRSRPLIYAPPNSVSSVDPQKRLSVAFIRDMGRQCAIKFVQRFVFFELSLDQDSGDRANVANEIRFDRGNVRRRGRGGCPIAVSPILGHRL